MTMQITPEAQIAIGQTLSGLWDRYGEQALKKGAGWAKDKGASWLGIERYCNSLFERVGYIRILGRMEAEPLENVFTHLNVLDRPSAERRYDLARLVAEFGPRDFDALEREKRVPGEEAVADFSKLFILGKPGAGKTTFLKHTALRALNGEIEKVPIFVTLKELADSDEEIVPFITRQFKVHNFANAEAFVADLLKDGEAIVLFDGLDEVNLADDQRATMIGRLNDFVYQYGSCQILITCRVAATDYSFTQFAYVEMADFDEEQIGRYVDLWFEGDEPKRLGCSAALLENPESRGVRELARVPLLLSLLCLVYDDLGHLPVEVHEIYGEATDALLKDWDNQRLIERDPIYERLTLRRREELLASIAASNFEHDVFYFGEKDLERQIEAFLIEKLKIEVPDGGLVLQALEAQHGILVERAHRIHSFSHLTLQEYFTAQYIVNNESRGSVLGLMEHVGDYRWREVFLLVAGMLSDATAFCEAYLQAVANMVAGEAQLLDLLGWASQNAGRCETSYKPAAVRAFLLYRGFNRARGADRELWRDLDRLGAFEVLQFPDLQVEVDIQPIVDKMSELDLKGTFDRSQSRALHVAVARAGTLTRDLDHDLHLSLYLDRALDLDLNFSMAVAGDHFRDLTLVASRRFRDDTRAIGYERSLDLAEKWHNSALATGLIDLGAAPVIEEGDGLQPLKPWLSQFRELMEPTRPLWDPYTQFPVSEEEAERFRGLSENQLAVWQRYLESNLQLLRCMAVAYLPNRAGIEDQMILPPS